MMKIKMIVGSGAVKYFRVPNISLNLLICCFFNEIRVPIFDDFKDPHAMLAPIRNDEVVKFPVFLVCIHSVEITQI